MGEHGILMSIRRVNGNLEATYGDQIRSANLFDGSASCYAKAEFLVVNPCPL